MSKYADVYLVPILEENIPAYKKLATAVGKIFMMHGALRYREYIGSDLDIQDVVPFPKKIKLKEGETLVYASVEFRSEAHRNKVMKAIFADPAMTGFANAEELFDCKRMVYGGFKILVDL
ncbi:MAG: DUF1428 domain-containing protein [Acidobacteria bacterium]|nr:DUF1428 domain-containing protein [Acidobacteriota bacterium]